MKRVALCCLAKRPRRSVPKPVTAHRRLIDDDVRPERVS